MNRGAKKGDNFRYLLQWIIVILTITVGPCSSTTISSNFAGGDHRPETSTKARSATRTLQNSQNNETDYGGSNECPCIDSSRVLSTISDCLMDSGSPGFTALGGCYPLDYGTTCQAHNMIFDPLCVAGGNDVPSYCYDQWCYVDYDKCKVSGEYFYRSDYSGESEDLYYSYSSCSSTANGWLEYQTRSNVDQARLKVTIPRMRFPDHFKYTEEGIIATDDSYYYNDSIPWAGSIIDYLNAVSEVSNMGAFQYTARSIGAGRAHPESSYTASVHDVSAGVSDVGGGTFWITSHRLSMTTFSTPFGVDRIHLIVKQPEGEKSTVRESAEKIAMPFTVGLWVLLWAVIVITAVLIVFLDRGEGVDGIWTNKTTGPYWDKSSPQRRLGVLMKSFLDSFIIHSSHMLGHAVEFDPHTTMAQKVVYFGFAVVIFIAVAAYTANLAAFLTLSGSVTYISNMEEAIATNTPICVNPVLEEEFSAAWPGATFIYNRTAEGSGFESLMGILHNYDDGKCGAIGYQFDTGVVTNQDFMAELCKRELVTTQSYILEKPLAFPVRSEYAAGISYWLYEAEKQGITYNFFTEKRLPAPLCSLSVSMISPDVNELLSLQPSSMILPLLVWICCIVAALVLHALRIKKKNHRHRKRTEREYAASQIGREAPALESVIPEINTESYRVSRPSLRHRRPSHVDQSEFSDVLQRHHLEIMRKLAELTSNNESVSTGTTATTTEYLESTENHPETTPNNGMVYAETAASHVQPTQHHVEFREEDSIHVIDLSQRQEEQEDSTHNGSVRLVDLSIGGYY